MSIPAEERIDLDTADLISTSLAARLVRTHVATIYRWIRRGKLLAFRAGRRFKVRRSDVAALLEPVQPQGKCDENRATAVQARKRLERATDQRTRRTLIEAGIVDADG